MEYDDIMGLPRPVSKRHRPMPLANRAAQFAPFAALTGHGQALAETARQTSPLPELSDDEMHVLSSRLSYAIGMISSRPRLTFTLFRPDSRKEGGDYVTVTGAMMKYDGYERMIVLTDGTHIPARHIVGIDGELFDSPMAQS